MAVSKTKAKLVDVARQLFAKNGVDDTTMNDIALWLPRKEDARSIRISRAKMTFIWQWWSRS